MRLILARLLAVVLLPLAVQAAPLPLVTGTEYPPFADDDEPGGGLAVRIVKAVFERMGDSVRIDVLPWKRGYVMTLAGQYLATFPYIHTQERERDFLYSDAIINGGSYLYTLPGKQFEVSDPTSLKGHSLCAPHGWSTPAETVLAAAIGRGDIRMERPADLAGCLRLVAAGRADAFVSLEAVADRLMRETGMPNRFQRAAQPVQVVELALIAPRNNAGSAGLLAKFNEGLKAMRADGSYKRLLDSR